MNLFQCGCQRLYSSTVILTVLIDISALKHWNSKLQREMNYHKWPQASFTALCSVKKQQNNQTNLSHLHIWSNISNRPIPVDNVDWLIYHSGSGLNDTSSRYLLFSKWSTSIWCPFISKMTTRQHDKNCILLLFNLNQNLV